MGNKVALLTLVGCTVKSLGFATEPGIIRVRDDEGRTVDIQHPAGTKASALLQPLPDNWPRLQGLCIDNVSVNEYHNEVPISFDAPDDWSPPDSAYTFTELRISNDRETVLFHFFRRGDDKEQELIGDEIEPAKKVPA